MGKDFMRRIVVELAGGLGNQAYMLLAAQSLANEAGATKLCFVRSLQFQRSSHGSSITKLNLASEEQGLMPNALARSRMIIMFYLSRLLGGKYVGFWNRYCWSRVPEINPPKPTTKGDVYIRGYFQTSTYANEWRSKNTLEIRNPSTGLQELMQVCSRKKILAMHVRRGDYATHEETHGLVPLSFYREALEFAIETHGLPSEIWIFSDDIDFCKTELQRYLEIELEFPELRWNLATEEAFVAFSKAHILVTGNSTFSILAATMSQAALVIAPDPPFRCLEVSQALYPSNFHRLKLTWPPLKSISQRTG